MDEQEHAASPETSQEQAPAGPAPGNPPPAGPPAAGSSAAETLPVTGEPAGTGRDRRADGLRETLTSRGAGWTAAAAMAGAVVGLSVAMATSSSPTVVVRPEGLGGSPAGAVRAQAPGGAVRAQVPGGAVRVLAPVRMRLQAPARPPARAPAGAPVQAPARLRVQIPAGAPLQTPARLRIQIPAGARFQTPARLRRPAQAPAAGTPAAGTLIPLPRMQAAPAARVPVTALTPRSLRLRVRPAQVRVRLRIPASARIQALPGGLPRQLRLVTPGQVLPAAVLPAEAPSPVRLRVVFQKGGPVPARLVLPAKLPGQARLRIQIPARARLTPALPAPPNW